MPKKFDLVESLENKIRMKEKYIKKHQEDIESIKLWLNRVKKSNVD